MPPLSLIAARRLRLRLHPFTNRVPNLAPVVLRPIKPNVDRPVATRTPVRISPIPTMPLPTSPQSLYRNLLLMTSNPPFSISEAIDYYFDWPKSLHSTKSFNLLISLALRSASFAPVTRLFSAMRTESIPANLETWRLHVRWFVRTGRWNDAWECVLEITRKQNVTTKFPANPIPLPLWLELFGVQKRGALRHWVITDHKPNLADGCGLTSEAVSRAGRNTSPDAGLEDVQESRLDAGVGDAANSTSLLRKQLVPYPCQRFKLSQYRALMQVSPLPDQVQIIPRTILIITQTMYQVGQRKLALSTALSYVKSLPPRLRRCDRRRVLDLVNLHLSMVTRHRKPGLKQHFTQRRTLRKFLHARPELTPSSRTLFLLLGPLRSCRRSGTLAMQCLHLFEKRWGPRVQSRLVRRRVASFALKEGRLDIVEAMMRLEWRCRVSDDTFPRTLYASRRRPWQTLFSRRGAENRRWHLIEEKYRRRLILRSEP
ncbi:hypothetical protein J3R82DRAFT_715 [Butyriboletus roseoflavus]|nr:hypothetical protein J3R82DRAFT_715 [Butyriboletus roseoflavus]